MSRARTSPLDKLVDDVLVAQAELCSLFGYPPPSAPPGATAREIQRFEKWRNCKLPPSYKEILKKHNGIGRLWSDFSFVGVAGSDAIKVFNRIQLITWIDTDETDPPLVDEAMIRERETQGHYYLPNHLPIGTNMARELIFYDESTQRRDGEMELVLWRPDEFPHPKFSTLRELLEWMLADIKAELHSASQPTKSAKTRRR